MIDNRYGIAEPDNDEIIEAVALDAIFLPLTAFDQHGHRLGMGGGYYDRTLSEFDHDRLNLIGLAYDFQELPNCPVEAFDQSLQMILTPTRFIEIN